MARARVLAYVAAGCLVSCFAVCAVSLQDARGDPDTKERRLADEVAVVRARLKAGALEGLQMMDSKERNLFSEYVATLEGWKAGNVASRDMNKLLNWQPRKMKCTVVAPRTTVRLGESVRVAVILQNESDKAAVVFPFEAARITERGHKEHGTRTNVIALNERPSPSRRLYLVPAGDAVVLGFDLGCQPAGAHRLTTVVNTAAFQDRPGRLGFGMSQAAKRTFEFKVLPAGE